MNINIRKANTLIADLHCDAALQMIRGYDISIRHNDYHVDLPRLKEGGVDIQVFASLAHRFIKGKSEFDIVNEYIDCLKSEFVKNNDFIVLCKNSSEIRLAKKENRIAAILAIEGGTALNDDLTILKHFYNKGVRLLTLVHEQSTSWCLSWSDKHPAFTGITDYGKEIIAEMNRLGMIIDISHCAASSAAAAIESSQSPVVASHSCADSLCPSGRNLTDNLIKAVADKGGVIGVTFVYFILSQEMNKHSEELRKKYPEEIKKISELFISNKPEEELQNELRMHLSFIEKYESPLKRFRPTVKTVVDHIEYITNLGGIDCAAIGSDFDGMTMPPIGLEDCSKIQNLADELYFRGYKENQIEKIMGLNFLRVFKEVCG